MNGHPPANGFSARIARVYGLVPAPLLLLLAALLVGLAGIVHWHSEPALRLAGAFWQLVGLALVFHQIVATARLFGRPGPRRAIGQWFERAKSAWTPRIFNESVVESMEARDSMQAHGHVGDLNLDLDQRVRQLEEHLERVEVQIEEVNRELRQKLDDADARLTANLNRATGRIEELSGRVENYAAGDLLGAFVGALLTAFGLFVSSGSTELARIFFCSPA